MFAGGAGLSRCRTDERYLLRQLLDHHPLEIYGQGDSIPRSIRSSISPKTETAPPEDRCR